MPSLDPLLKGTQFRSSGAGFPGETTMYSTGEGGVSCLNNHLKTALYIRPALQRADRNAEAPLKTDKSHPISTDLSYRKSVKRSVDAHHRENGVPGEAMAQINDKTGVWASPQLQGHSRERNLPGIFTRAVGHCFTSKLNIVSTGNS